MIRDITNPDDPRHGTYNGYRAHDRENDEPCPACLKGRAAYERERYDRRKARPCVRCGRSVRSRSDLCAACKKLPETLRESDLLLDGWWVRDGLTLRWVPADQVAGTVRPVETPKPPCGTEAGYQWHRHQWRKHRIGTWPLPADDPCGCRAAHAGAAAFKGEMRRQGRAA